MKIIKTLKNTKIQRYKHTTTHPHKHTKNTNIQTNKMNKQTNEETAKTSKLYIDTLFFGEIKTFDTKTFVVPNLDAKKTIKKNVCHYIHYYHYCYYYHF